MNYPIASGRLNREITFYAPASTLNDRGEAIPSSRAICTVPAEIKQKVSSTLVARITYTITTRFVEEVTEDWELVTDGGRRLVITALDPQPTIDALIITAAAAQRAAS